MKYEGYCSLLLAAASQYDASHASKRSQPKGHRQISYHDFEVDPDFDPDYFAEDEPENIDIDMPPDTFLEVNMQ